MESAFKITFDLNLDNSSKTLRLEGTVLLHHSVPHYKINRINRIGVVNQRDLLPEVDIKCIISDGGYKWVHTDSGKETYLSTAIGRGIEEVMGTPAVATDSDNEHDDEQF